MRGRLPPLQPFAHHEHGKDADPSFKNLFAGNAKVTNLTDLTGSEVDGVQLTDLTERGKDELALFVAKRKVVGSSVLFSPPILPTGLNRCFVKISIPQPKLCLHSHSRCFGTCLLFRPFAHPPYIRSSRGPSRGASSPPRCRGHYRQSPPRETNEFDNLAQ